MSDMETRIAETLNGHHQTRGMAVASGVTCECGYWTGKEVAGKNRPVGVGGRDQLDWHRAQVLAPLIAESQAVALEEAAQVFGADEWIDALICAENDIESVQGMTAWMKDRATQIRVSDG